MSRVAAAEYREKRANERMSCVRRWLAGLQPASEVAFCENCQRLSDCTTDPEWQHRTIGEARVMFPCLQK